MIDLGTFAFMIREKQHSAQEAGSSTEVLGMAVLLDLTRMIKQADGASKHLQVCGPLDHMTAEGFLPSMGGEEAPSLVVVSKLTRRPLIDLWVETKREQNGNHSVLFKGADLLKGSRSGQTIAQLDSTNEDLGAVAEAIVRHVNAVLVREKPFLRPSDSFSRLRLS